jgi:hypothetical protein
MANKIIEWAVPERSRPKHEAIQTPEPTDQHDRTCHGQEQRNLLLNGKKRGKRKNGG